MNLENYNSEALCPEQQLEQELDRLAKRGRREGRYLALYGIFIVVTMLFLLFHDYIHLTLNLGESARSDIAEGALTLWAVFITISLVIVQLTATTYAPTVLKLFRKHWDFLILLPFYTIVLFYIIGWGNGTYSFILEAGCFLLLIPYLFRTLEFLRPAVLIRTQSKDVRKDKIIKNVQGPNKEQEEDDPLQPIIDIVYASAKKNDFETVWYGLNLIRVVICWIFQNEEVESEEEYKKKPKNKRGNEPEERKIWFSVFVKHLRPLGNAAVRDRDGRTLAEVIDQIGYIGECTLKKYKFMVEESARYIEDLGEIAAQNRFGQATRWAIKWLAYFAAADVEGAEEALKDVVGKAKAAKANHMEEAIKFAMGDCISIGNKKNKEEKEIWEKAHDKIKYYFEMGQSDTTT